MEEILSSVNPLFFFKKTQKSFILKVPSNNRKELPCMSNDIRNLLNIKDPNIHFEENCVQREEQAIQIHCTLTYPLEECPHCQDKHSIVYNGTRSSRITYLDTAGQACYLIMKKQRYRCKTCHHCFTAQTQLVPRNGFISLPTKQFIASLSTDTTSEKSIAQRCRVSSHTVRRVIDDYAATIRQRPTTLPESLCFDEFKSTASCKGAMSFIFCDAITHQVIDVIEDRRLGSLKAYFYRFSRKERKKVKAIIIDFYLPYMFLIRELFPNAVIIIDPFHIIQSLNRELNRYRVSFMNSIRYKDSKLYNKLKRYWRLILMDPDRLVHTNYLRFPLFNHPTNTGSIIDYLLGQDDLLKETYETVHRLVSAIRDRDFDRFKETIDQSKIKTLPKGLKRVIRSFNKYLETIKNTCHHPRLSNGPIEGINNKIKVLKRNAYGYRNYSHFRHRILLIARLYVSGRNKEGTKQVLAA